MRTNVQALRRQRVLTKLLARRDRISTRQLARRFGVNEITIRRDLKALQDSGAAVRCYGGAVAAQRITFEFAFDERRRRLLAEKQRIGDAAAAQIRDGQSIFLDTGTTTLEIARAIVARGVACTVATSSLVIASELWGRGNLERLLLLGGQVRPGSPDLVGPGTEVMLEKLTADIAFLGSDGIDPARGSFAADFESARVAERMIASAKRIVVAADHSKLGNSSTARYAAIEDLDEVITDRQADEKIVAALRERGVTVTLA